MSKIKPEMFDTRNKAEERMKELIVIQEGIFCPDINAMCRQDCRDFNATIKGTNKSSEKKDEMWDMVKEFDNKKDEPEDGFTVTVCCERFIKNNKSEEKQQQFGLGI